jgi:hypothetical protein
LRPTHFSWGLCPQTPIVGKNRFAVFSKSLTFASRRIFSKYRGIYSALPLVMVFAYAAVSAAQKPRPLQPSTSCFGFSGRLRPLPAPSLAPFPPFGRRGLRQKAKPFALRGRGIFHSHTGAFTGSIRRILKIG